MAKQASKHHVCIYQGKTVTLDLDDPKQEWKMACFRVQYNLTSEMFGYVIDPKGRVWKISKYGKSAQPATDFTGHNPNV